MQVVDLSRNFSLSEYSRSSHSGTHVDSPAYLQDGMRNIGDFPLNRFICDAGLLDLRHKKAGEPIDDEDLEAAEESAGLALREGEAVVLFTGIEEPTANVYLSQNGAEYLEFKGVGLVASDSVSVDSFDSTDLVAHRILLGKEILILEGLNNVAAVGLSRFRLACFPLKLNAGASPVRAVAVLE
jgi:kynurenine formamidase